MNIITYIFGESGCIYNSFGLMTRSKLIYDINNWFMNVYDTNYVLYLITMTGVCIALALVIYLTVTICSRLLKKVTTKWNH